MTRALTVDGTAFTTVDFATASFVETAYKGESGMSGIDLDDTALLNPLTMKAVAFTESASVYGASVFRGYVGKRLIRRDEGRTTESDREWEVEILDGNTLLDDVVLTAATASRGQETDYARVVWAVGAAFAVTVGTTFVPNTNTVTVDLADYRGRKARDVLDECAEASGKNYFLFWYDTTASWELFYDLGAGTAWTSPLRLSSSPGDADNAVTFAPEFGESENGRELDPVRVYSGVRVEYDGGSIYVTNASTTSNYRRREQNIYYSVSSSAVATTLANQFLAAAAGEEDTIRCSVYLTAANINGIRHGQRIQVKFPHLGISSYTYYRVTRRTVRPLPIDSPHAQYALDLELANPKLTRFIDRIVRPGRGEPANPPTVATVVAGATCSGVPEPHTYTVTRTGLGVITDGPLSGIVAATAKFGSSVWYNSGWAAAGCPIGGGGWDGYWDTDLWFKFVGPADASNILGLLWTVDASAIAKLGVGSGFSVRITSSAPGSGTGIGGGQPITLGPESGSSTVYIPRNLVTWGADNWLNLHPDWQCARDAFFCNAAAYFGGPETDGRGNSGSIANLAVSVLCVAQFAAGTTGIAPGVAGYGAVDGLNRLFTLIGWTGAGPVGYTINGLEQPTGGLTLDGTAKTALTDAPPPLGSATLWTYPVSV